MQAFGLGDAGNHYLPFRLSQGRSWSHQNPYCCSFALNRSRRSLSYKEWFTPPINRVAGNGELLLPNCEASFHAHTQRCPAVYSPVADGDSSRAPVGCRFKRCKEIIKAEEPSAKIGLALFHLSAQSAYARKYDTSWEKIKGCGLRVFSGYTSAVPCRVDLPSRSSYGTLWRHGTSGASLGPAEVHWPLEWPGPLNQEQKGLFEYHGATWSWMGS